MVIYYVALPFTRVDGGLASGPAVECPHEAAAIRRAYTIRDRNTAVLFDWLVAALTDNEHVAAGDVIARIKTDQASALINAARNTGGSIGVSLVSNVLTHREQFHQSRLVEQVIPSSAQYQDTLQQITSYFTAHGSALAQAHDQAIQWIGQQVQAQASFLAYMDAFWAPASVPTGSPACRSGRSTLPSSRASAEFPCRPPARVLGASHRTLVQRHKCMHRLAAGRRCATTAQSYELGPRYGERSKRLLHASTGATMVSAGRNDRGDQLP